MKKKIIALILVIPLILLFTVFNIGETIAITIPVPVSGISLDYEVGESVVTEDEDNILMDIANINDAQHTLKLTPTVLPANANDSDYRYTQEAVDGADQGEVLIDKESGYVTLVKKGIVRIVVTSTDGGYTDSIVLKIKASKPSEIVVVAPPELPVSETGAYIATLTDGELNLSVTTDSDDAAADAYDGYVNWQWWKEGSGVNVSTTVTSLGEQGRWIDFTDVDNPCPYLSLVSVNGVFEVLQTGTVKLRVVLSGDYTAKQEPVMQEIVVEVVKPADAYVFLKTNGISTQDKFNYQLNTYSGNTSFRISINPEAFAAEYGKDPAEVAATEWAELLQMQPLTDATLAYNYLEEDDILEIAVTFTTAQDTAESLAEFKLYGDELKVTVNLLDSPEASLFSWNKTVNENNEYYCRIMEKSVMVNGESTISYADTLEQILQLSVDRSLKGTSIRYQFTMEENGIAQFKDSRPNPLSPQTYVQYKGNGATGTVTVNVTITISFLNEAGVVEEYPTINKSIKITYLYASTNLAAAGNAVYGIGRTLAVGEYKLDLARVDSFADSTVSVSKPEDLVNFIPDAYVVRLLYAHAQDNIIWSSSDTSIAEINNGVVDIKSTGIVTFTAVSANAAKIGITATATLTLRCVKDAVNIYDYDGLLCVSLADRVGVLRNTIGNEEDEAVFGTTSARLQVYQRYAKIRSNLTLKEYKYDVKNKGSEGDPNKVVAYITRKANSDLQFIVNVQGDNDDKTVGTRLRGDTINIGLIINNDLHGNGYTLNAANLTTVQSNLDITDFEIFNGPVTFVAAELLGYTVYGQDNIAFLIEKDNVKVDNCAMQSTDIKGMVEDLEFADLTKLDYAGTTVEVTGENVSITNCRLSRGRTVLRIFSGNADQNVSGWDSKTSVTVERCILSHSREFTVRIGCNQVIKDSVNYPSSSQNYGPPLESYTAPNLYNASQTAALQSVRCDEINQQLLANEEFLSKYLRTEVVIKDCLFTDSGIFSIGMDSHFAGQYLNGIGHSGQGYGLGWQNCAGTSYAAKLTLQGQVRFYDWKDIADIKTYSVVGYQPDVAGIKKGDKDASREYDPFGMVTLLDKYHKDNQFMDLLHLESANGDMKYYAHAAIVFFGGGRNYSLFVNECDDSVYGVNDESVCVNIRQIVDGGGTGNMLLDNLRVCAGDGNFRFYVNRADGGNGLAQQREDLANGNSHSWLTGN